MPADACTVVTAIHTYPTKDSKSYPLRAFYINTLLALAGYRLFQVSTPRGASAVLPTRRRYLSPHTSLTARQLSDYVYWETRQ